MNISNIIPNKKYLNAPNQDLSLNLNLETHSKQLNEYDRTSIVSAYNIFQDEINKSDDYKLYFTLTYNNMLNGKKNLLTKIEDIFTNVETNKHNFYEYFDVYVCYLDKLVRLDNDVYQQYFKKLTTTNDYKLNYFSYNKDIFNNNTFSLIINKTFNTKDIKTKVIYIDDDYNEVIETELPITDFYLYFEPKFNSKLILPNNLDVLSLHPDTLYGYNNEEIDSTIINFIRPQHITLNNFMLYFYDKLKLFCNYFNIKADLNSLTLNRLMILNFLGLNVSLMYDDIDQLKGGYVKISKTDFTFNVFSEAFYIYKTQLNDTYNGVNINNYVILNYNKYDYTLNNNSILIDFTFKFKPYHKIPIKTYSSQLTLNNEYGFIIDTVRVGRTLNLNSDIDSLNHPFINNTHYVYNNIVFNIEYDYNYNNTNVLINDLKNEIEINNFRLDKNKQIKQLKNKLC